MGWIDAQGQYRAVSDGEQLAIWALRRVRNDEGSRFSATANARWSLERDLVEVIATLRDLIGERDKSSSRGCSVQLGLPESMALTKDERRLLDAVAAAQAEDSELLDNYLYKLALDYKARSLLAEAVTRLSACLAVQGYWLPKPLGSLVVSGAALTVARVHGRDIQEVRVAWP